MMMMIIIIIVIIIIIIIKYSIIDFAIGRSHSKFNLAAGYHWIVCRVLLSADNS